MDELTYADLVGRSQAFLETMRFIERVAQTDAPVLIEGETGTGKELAARAIHARGSRCNRPFVAVNCGALPDALVENELFGHARGAFTDAKEAQPGLIAIASGGTLFLDEVDTLSCRGQVALLRFLQDLNFRPLGGRDEQRADLRVITATNARLADLVRTKQFRVDLYYRLEILRLQLPPLRERHGDPILLAQHFSRVLSARYHVPERQIDPSAEQLLNAYEWPGNVRELENLVHRAFLLTSARRICIGPEYLGFPLGAGFVDGGAGTRARAEREFQRAKANAIEAFERSYLSRLLAESKGNVSLAARLCGKERRTFGKLLRKYSIDRRQYSSDSQTAATAQDLRDGLKHP